MEEERHKATTLCNGLSLTRSDREPLSLRHAALGFYGCLEAGAADQDPGHSFHQVPCVSRSSLPLACDTDITVVELPHFSV